MAGAIPCFSYRKKTDGFHSDILYLESDVLLSHFCSIQKYFDSFRFFSKKFKLSDDKIFLFFFFNYLMIRKNVITRNIKSVHKLRVS